MALICSSRFTLRLHVGVHTKYTTGIFTFLFFHLDLIEEAPEAATTNPLAERLKQGAGSTFLLVIVQSNTDIAHCYVYFAIFMRKRKK